MKLKINCKLITAALLIINFHSFSQKNVIQKSIYFESARYDLSMDSRTVLDKLADTLSYFKSYSIHVSGNTDNTGDSTYNQSLSEQRAKAAKQYLANKGIRSKLISTEGYGKNKPVTDNSTDLGKQKNRRVDINIYYTRKIAVDTLKHLPSITELYRQIETKPQTFCVDPGRDTSIRCDKGAVIYIRANSFNIPKYCKSKCVTIKVREEFLTSDMILDHLSTTSNGQIIESQGMIYTEATDCKGRKLNLLKGKDIVIFSPTDSFVPGAKVFQGNREGEDSNMNWTSFKNTELLNYSFRSINDCYQYWWRVYYETANSCPFFFCKIHLFFQKLFNNRENEKKTKVALWNENDCAALKALFDKYGVTNLNDLFYALNKKLIDSFGVRTQAELNDKLRNLNLKKIEAGYLGKKISYDDLKYYVYNVPKLGWSNIDCLASFRSNERVNMKVNLKVTDNIDCKLVLKGRRIVIPPTNFNGQFIFSNVPAGEPVWLIAIKYDNGKPYLSMTETQIAQGPFDVDFKIMTLDELKNRLKKLDE